MWWGDYSAKPAHDYTYKIVPVYGTPASPVLDDARSVTLDVSTSDPATGKHGIYFNRGVAASQAYATKFGAAPAGPAAREAGRSDDLAVPRPARGAVADSSPTAASPQLVVRAAAYEFTEPTVLAAFAQAHAAGADVKIIYHDKPNDPQSALNDAGHLRRPARPGHAHRPHHPTIAHNKFIVRATRAADGTLSGEQVWTGSTNMSQGGIFGHSNVGHAVRDPTSPAPTSATGPNCPATPPPSPSRRGCQRTAPSTAPRRQRRNPYLVQPPPGSAAARLVRRWFHRQHRDRAHHFAVRHGRQALRAGRRRHGSRRAAALRHAEHPGRPPGHLVTRPGHTGRSRRRGWPGRALAMGKGNADRL